MTEEKSNRPKDNQLYQQRLKAWTPMLTMKDAFIFFLVTGIVVIAIGLAIFFSDSQVLQFSTDYTNCYDNTRNVSCSNNDSNIYNIKCTCIITVQVTSDMQTPVFFYYGLTNYYQNHRQLINSIDTNQLTGSLTTPSSTCGTVLNDSSGNFYAPCGQLPNVIFNDTFTLQLNNSLVPWSKQNISMDSDRKRYGTPTTWINTVKPPFWPVNATTRSPNAYVGDEELLVWLRPSPLPTLRKLSRILRQGGPAPFTDKLPRGNYTLIVNYNYPVTSFGGHKLFIISTVSWIGGKNPALGILYLVTGCIEVLIGFILFVIWMKSRGQIEYFPSYQTRSQIGR